MKRFAFILAIISLSGCIPIQNTALGALNALGRATDGTTLAIYQKDIVFTPVGTKEDVVLTVQGENLTTDDINCNIRPDGILCIVDEIATETTFNITGSDVSAWISWTEDGELLAKFIIAK